ncbi:STAS domain-containing protein [Candidatus Sumerlaeota bacterium]|nr:STAS domain-containing protein [Candidatus Sumerlaeota bacterium]MBI3735511.1 STAS domain-containing protein [Candidatus Sumerlaeota bacterium]
MESILYARLPDDIVVIRVCGRGNHQNSLALREAANLTGAEGHAPRYIFDLDQCPTMDSTFMGVLASIALKQQKSLGSKCVVVNANDHVRELLNNLGLKFVLDIRATPDAAGVNLPGESGEFAQVDAPQVDKLNRIVLMIEAHQKLIDVSSDNEVQFKGVLQSLKDSLDRTRGAQP